ncbi:SRPBCC family protein [Kordiimonas aestuarii]|uniref:SRPBCC family protein n=1 Tax=Kordiimonas aestuarii TaxID=1005925 RepID=UPI0021CEBBAD|nr:SRPBCC family protein [Kordiimonas aestuarii]
MTVNDSYAQKSADDTIEIKRLFPGPIERVFSYLTDAEKRGKWLAGGDDIRTEPGQEFTLVFRHGTLSALGEKAPDQYKASDAPAGIRSRCTLDAITPPHSLTMSWGESFGDVSEVTFSLEKQGDKVLMTITHRKLTTPELMADVSGGWHAHLDIMVDVLEGKPARAFWANHTRLDTEYRKRLKAN